jgi:hypothetical protein
MVVSVDPAQDAASTASLLDLDESRAIFTHPGTGGAESAPLRPYLHGTLLSFTVTLVFRDPLPPGSTIVALSGLFQGRTHPAAKISWKRRITSVLAGFRRVFVRRGPKKTVSANRRPRLHVIDPETPPEKSPESQAAAPGGFFAPPDEERRGEAEDGGRYLSRRFTETGRSCRLHALLNTRRLPIADKTRPLIWLSAYAPGVAYEPMPLRLPGAVIDSMIVMRATPAFVTTVFESEAREGRFTETIRFRRSDGKPVKIRFLKEEGERLDTLKTRITGDHICKIHIDEDRVPFKAGDDALGKRIQRLRFSDDVTKGLLTAVVPVIIYQRPPPGTVAATVEKPTGGA